LNGVVRRRGQSSKLVRIWFVQNLLLYKLMYGKRNSLDVRQNVAMKNCIWHTQKSIIEIAYNYVSPGNTQNLHSVGSKMLPLWQHISVKIQFPLTYSLTYLHFVPNYKITTCTVVQIPAGPPIAPTFVSTRTLGPAVCVEKVGRREQIPELAQVRRISKQDLVNKQY